MRYRSVRVDSYRLTYLCVIGWFAVIDGRNYDRGVISTIHCLRFDICIAVTVLK